WVSMVRPGDPRSTSWPFRPWAKVGQDDFLIARGSIRVPGTKQHRVVTVGSSHLVLVDAPEGAPRGTELALKAPPAGADAWDAEVADVDGDGYNDLVLDDSKSVFQLYRGTGGGNLTNVPEAMQLPKGLAVAYFRFIPTSAGPPDMLLELAHGAWMVLKNDGKGHFR